MRKGNAQDSKNVSQNIDSNSSSISSKDGPSRLEDSRQPALEGLLPSYANHRSRNEVLLCGHWKDEKHEQSYGEVIFGDGSRKW